jgi:hypothetical protein
MHCFAGCETSAVLGAIGLSIGDLFDRPLGESAGGRSPWSARDVLDVAMREVAVVAVVAADLTERRPITAADWFRLSQASSRLGRLVQMVRA